MQLTANSVVQGRPLYIIHFTPAAAESLQEMQNVVKIEKEVQEEKEEIKQDDNGNFLLLFICFYYSLPMPFVFLITFFVSGDMTLF